MENQRAIPQGYMTTGELAKRMGVTVRTLQHYGREGLLAPSCISEGGRRLYTNKDVVKLHQILSLKHLGFSLSDIKSRLISLDKPAEVADILTEQAAIVQKKIEALSESLNALETLREEVLRMQSVDFLICNCYLLYVTEKDGSVVSDIIHSSLLGNQRIIAGNAQFTGIAAGRGVGFTTGLLLLREGLGMRETPIRPHSWH